jgi:dihydrofolate reductase
MTNRKIIVNAGVSADGFIARPDGGIDWLTSRPKPAGFYGMGEFTKSIDAKILGRATVDKSLEMGATFDGKTKAYVISSRPPSKPIANVDFINEPISNFAKRLRSEPGKNIWMMGGGRAVASFLDAGAIDEIIMTVMPVLIGEGIPLIASKHRHVELKLLSSRPFDDGVVQLHYEVLRS